MAEVCFQLRVASASDCAVLSRVHSASFARGWGETEFASFFERDGIVALLAYQAEAPIGFIFCWVVAGESELLALAVLPTIRRSGAGRMLLHAAVGRCAAHGAAVMHLEVDIGNDAATRLYEAEGLEITGRRKGYYHLPDGRLSDALTMRKSLSFC